MGLDHPLDIALNMSYTETGRMRRSEDTVEGPKAFAEKRKPNWKGRYLATGRSDLAAQSDPLLRLRREPPRHYARLLDLDTAQLFFVVWVMKVPSCGVTFVLLHVGHLTLAFSLSEMVMVSSNGFLHFLHMNSYLGMVILPDQSSSRRAHPARRSKIRMHRVGIEVAGPVGTCARAPPPPSRLPDQEHLIVPADALSNFQCHLSAAQRLLHWAAFHLERLHGLRELARPTRDPDVIADV